MGIRQLGETELFRARLGQAEQASIGSAIRMKLNQNIGDIEQEF